MQVQALAARHDQSLSQLCRDALHLLLSDPAPYLALLSSRVLARHPRPTPAQAAASERLIADAALVDLGALVAACSPSPPALHPTLTPTSTFEPVRKNHPD